MGHATEPAHETLPSAWAGIHEQLRSGRDWLDDAYVSTRDFQFRVGRLGELEEKHKTELAAHRMSLVAGAPPGPAPSDPHAGFVGALRPDDLVRAPSSGDLIPYLSVRRDRDTFLGTKRALSDLTKTPALSPSPNTRRLGVKRKPHLRPDRGHPRLQ